MIEEILLLWAAAFPLMGSPGPATISLAGVGTAFGFRQGLVYLAGIILGTIGVLLLIATGVTAIVLTQPKLIGFVSILAAAYILYLAWKIATAPVGRSGDELSKAPAFWPGLVLALANPKAFAAIGAVYAAQTLSEDSWITDAVVKVVALAVVVFVVNAAWLAFGSVFARVLSHPQLGRIANIAFAILLVTSVGLTFLSNG